MNDIQKRVILNMKKLINEYGSLFPIFLVVAILAWQVLGIWR